MYDRDGQVRLTGIEAEMRRAELEAHRAEAEAWRVEIEARRNQALKEKLRSLGVDPDQIV